MARPFRFDGRWSFSATPDELWRAFSDTERLQEWWPWLRTLESSGLVEGTVSRCVVRAPVPYTVSVEIAINQVVPSRLVIAAVSGDLEGPARLDVAPQPGGSEARLSWELEARAPLLRAASLFARPVMDWGHKWVVDNGVRQFRRKALGEEPPPDPTDGLTG
jgi:uncharacterized protein YndB with AHSA1/START domain